MKTAVGELVIVGGPSTSSSRNASPIGPELGWASMNRPYQPPEPVAGVPDKKIQPAPSCFQGLEGWVMKCVPQPFRELFFESCLKSFLFCIRNSIRRVAKELSYQMVNRRYGRRSLRAIGDRLPEKLVEEVVRGLNRDCFCRFRGSGRRLQQPLYLPACRESSRRVQELVAQFDKSRQGLDMRKKLIRMEVI